MQVFPTRVFLNQRVTSAHLSLKNTTESPQKYKIELKFFKMNGLGQFEEVSRPDESVSLVKNIKFSPTEVSLDSGAQQTVRLMLVNFDKLKLPEYYIHIYFLPESKKEDSEKIKTKQFQLQGKVAVAIPILFRNGTVSYDPEVKNTSIKLADQGQLILKTQIKNKTGTFFYGDLELHELGEKKESDENKVISFLKGVSSYIPERELIWKIKKEDFEIKDLKLKPGSRLKLILKNDADDFIQFKKEVELTL